MKKHFLALLLCLVSFSAISQQKGHFILGGGTEIILGSGTGDSPSTLMYALEAGIAYNILESLRVTGTLGGFRSVMSFDNEGWQGESANGPMIRLGAQYLFLPEERKLRPLASLSAGYRLRIPPEADSPGRKVQGAFLTAEIGADLLLGGLRLGISVTGELTQSLRPAAGINLRVMLP